MQGNLSKQQGFTLIEVLIAATVLAVGLLALAGLQNQALKINHGTYLHSQAVILTQAIVAKIRANRLAGHNGDYNLSPAVAPIQANVDCSLATAVCDPQQLAQWDLWQWQQLLAQQLPQGVGEISVSSINTGLSGITDLDTVYQYRVSIYWNDRGEQRSIMVETQ